MRNVTVNRERNLCFNIFHINKNPDDDLVAAAWPSLARADVDVMLLN